MDETDELLVHKMSNVQDSSGLCETSENAEVGNHNSVNDGSSITSKGMEPVTMELISVADENNIDSTVENMALGERNIEKNVNPFLAELQEIDSNKDVFSHKKSSIEVEIHATENLADEKEDPEEEDCCKGKKFPGDRLDGEIISNPIAKADMLDQKQDSAVALSDKTINDIASAATDGEKCFGARETNGICSSESEEKGIFGIDSERETEKERENNAETEDELARIITDDNEEVDHFSVNDSRMSRLAMNLNYDADDFTTDDETVLEDIEIGESIACELLAAEKQPECESCQEDEFPQAYISSDEEDDANNEERKDIDLNSVCDGRNSVEIDLSEKSLSKNSFTSTESDTEDSESGESWVVYSDVDEIPKQPKGFFEEEEDKLSSEDLASLSSRGRLKDIHDGTVSEANVDLYYLEDTSNEQLIPKTQDESKAGYSSSGVKTQNAKPSTKRTAKIQSTDKGGRPDFSRLEVRFHFSTYSTMEKIICIYYM